MRQSDLRQVENPKCAAARVVEETPGCPQPNRLQSQVDGLGCLADRARALSSGADWHTDWANETRHWANDRSGKRGFFAVDVWVKRQID